MHEIKIALWACLLLGSTASYAVDCDSACQLKQVKLYFNALDKISRTESKVADVDALLLLTHDAVKYIHVEYEANFDKTTWRKAFIRNLKRGAYKSGPKDKTTVLNTIFGKNNSAIEYSKAKLLPNGTWDKGKPKLVLFGFTDGKISLVQEYW